MLDWDYEKNNGKYLITMENGKKYFMKECEVDNLQKQLGISEFEAIEMWLEDNGYLETYLKESPAGPARKYYHLTEKGKDYQQSQKEEWLQFIKKVEKLI